MVGNRHTSLLPALLCGLFALAQAAAATPVAQAEVFGFSLSDGSIAEAQGPLAAGTVYSGVFNAPSGQQDLDYVYFEVPQPETLRFDFVNTLSSCRPYQFPGGPVEPGFPETEPSCPMWATLIDAGGRQLGGEGSGAGTRAIEFSSYEEIEWAFPTPGRYYVVLESEYYGDRPTFQFSYGVVPAGGGTGGTGTGGGSGGAGSGGGSGGGGAGAGGAGGPSGAGGSGGAPKGGALRGGEVGVAEGRPSASFTVSGSRSLIESLILARRQRGAHVVVTAVLAQRLSSLDLQLLARVGSHHRLVVVGHRLRRHPIAGREHIMLPVSAGRWLTSKRYVPLILRVRALTADGAAELVQGRLLLRR